MVRHRDKPWALIVVEVKPVPGARARLRDLGVRERARLSHAHVYAYAPGWFAGTDEVPRSFIGLPVIMIMPHLGVRARTSEKQRKGRDARSSLPCFTSRRANFLLARDKNILDW